MILRHPDSGYVFGRKVGVASCINAGKNIPIIFHQRPSGKCWVQGELCDCAWPVGNLEYLEYCSENKK